MDLRDLEVELEEMKLFTLTQVPDFEGKEGRIR